LIAASPVTADALAVIPARGGSKRIPRKNIRPMSGRPLLAWTVDLCRSLEVFADVIVSTDDEEIAEVARAAGATVPFLRPADLADDHASTVSVVRHAVRWFAEEHGPLRDACCIYPAAIFVGSREIVGAREALNSSDRPYCAAVVEYPHPVQRALVLDEAGRVTFAHPETAGMRTQDLPARWHDAGQFYWGRWSAWEEGTSILPNAIGFPLASGEVVDIDTEDDWERAAALHRLRAHGR
jgi:pseudaminic acid cytidylyltransferase